jgi:hypothetical protein
LSRPARPAVLVRPALAGLAAAAAALAVAGCGSIDAALGAQQATVIFRKDTPAATIQAVGQACGGPGVRPVAAAGVPVNGAPSAVRYDVRHASTGDLARLHHCLLAHFPDAVLGVALKDTANQG